MESANNLRGNAVSGSSDGTTALYQFSAAKSGCFNYSDDSDVSIVTFNIVCLSFFFLMFCWSVSACV